LEDTHDVSSQVTVQFTSCLQEKVKDKYEGKFQRRYDIIIFDSEDLIIFHDSRQQTCTLKNFKVLPILCFVNNSQSGGNYT